MDPELMQLFTSAKGSNKNVSGLLGNLDSPMLAYLAGVYDPVSAQGSKPGGALWSQYAGSQEPVIQDILSKIQGGADEFYLNSYIDALGAGDGISSTGFQLGDLKGLAKALQKEYTGTGGSGSGSGGKQDVWAKAGLRNPLDMYSTEDVPMNARSAKDIGVIRGGREKAQSSLGEAGLKTRAARRGVGTDSGLKDEVARGLLGSTSSIAKRQATQLAEWLKGQDYLTKESLMNKAEELMPEQRGESIPFKAAVEFAGEKIKKRGPAQGKVDKYKKAKETEGLAQQQVNAGAFDEEAYRRGMLKAYSAAGKTPTRDQLAGMLGFLSGSK